MTGIFIFGMHHEPPLVNQFIKWWTIRIEALMTSNCFVSPWKGNGKVSMSINYIFTPASNAKGRHRCQYCRIHLESATSQSAKRQLYNYSITLHYTFNSKNARDLKNAASQFANRQLLHYFTSQFFDITHSAVNTTAAV